MTGRRACIGCRGEGYVDGGLVDDWPTIAPCPECRPVTAARLDSGAYRPDAPVLGITLHEQGLAADPPRPAHWPAEKLALPPPGHRWTNPTPKGTP